MIAATVTVRTPSCALTFPAIGRSTATIAAVAERLFDVCGVTVIPLKKEPTCR